MRKVILFFILGFISFQSQAQADDEFIHSLGESLEKYYELERENIHVHFNKKSYFTDEQIWMNGYIFHQQSKTLYADTNNVFVEVFDNKGNQIIRKFIFANNGFFRANFSLSGIQNSGIYYIRFYTNWMNNFKEDLSSIYPIEIINSADEEYSSKLDFEDIFIELYPESGVFLAGQDNTVSIKLTDHKGNGVETKNGKIFDSNNTVISTFFTNSLGYGKIDINQTKQTSYRVEVENNGHTFSQNLTAPSQNGISVSVINFMVLGKTIFKIKATDLPTDENYYLLISQDKKMVAYPIAPENQEIILENSELFQGTNVVRIIDKNKNVKAERIFYNHTNPSKPVLTFRNNYTKSGIVNLGVKVQTETFMSISALPEKTASLPVHNIFNSIYVNPYTSEISQIPADYFTENNRRKAFELDLFFLKQKPKEVFSDILTDNYPQVRYTFDKGISIKGKVNQALKNKEIYSVALSSLGIGLWESSPIDDNNEFEFKNLVLPDSIWVNFSLLGAGKPSELAVYPKVENNFRNFTKKPIIPVYKTGSIEWKEPEDEQDNFYIPKFRNHIEIEAVEININRSRNLKRGKNNPLLRGIKAEDEGMSHLFVIDFLSFRGFKVSKSTTGGDIVISSRTSGFQSINASPSTSQVFIDDIEQFTLERLEFMRMDEVDEIYYDRNMVVPGMRNYEGIVKIYTKNQMGVVRDYSDGKVKPFLITNGFAKVTEYESPDYAGYDEAFNLYGTLHWESAVLTDEKNETVVKIPFLNQKATKLHIEGITSEGEIFSEVREFKF